MAKPPLTRILAIVAALPALLPLYVILKYGVDLHLYDEWNPAIAGVLVKAHQHQMTLADLFSQHNEHRLVVARLIFIPLAELTHWNNFGNMLAGWVISAWTCIITLRLVWQTCDDPCENPQNSFNRWRRFLCRGLLCSLVLFNPAQGEDWLWGIGMANFLPMTVVLPSLMVAQSKLAFRTRLVLCILLCCVATFTNANGFLAWPLTGCILALSEPRGAIREKCFGLMVQFAVFAAVAIGYFLHFTKPQFDQTHYLSREPVEIGKFLLAFLGNGFAPIRMANPQETAIFAGSVLLALYLFTLVYFAIAWQSRRYEFCRQILVWLAVGAFVVVSGAMAAAARSSQGIDAGLVSRYVTTSVYLPAALINLLPTICRDLALRMTSAGRMALLAVPVAFGLVLGAAVAMVYPPEWDAVQQWRGANRERKAALLLINVLPHTALLGQLTFLPIDRFLADANAVDEIGYLRPSLIHNPDASTLRRDDPDHLQSRGSIETVQRAGVEGLAVEGWAISPANHGAADAIFLTYDDDSHRPIIFYQGRIGKKRPDIGEKFGGSNDVSSGWTATFPLSILPLALKTVHITAWAMNVDTAAAYPLDRAFTIRR